MPYRMHSEYLRRLFLNNDLFEGRYTVFGRNIALSDIRAPIFAVATEKDHVAPWQSVYKIMLLSETEVTFVLTNGGHNAGIVSEPGHRGRHFQMSTRSAKQSYEDPLTWKSIQSIHDGSWWPAWCDWLERDGHPRKAPPEIGAQKAGYPPLGAAPGTYVLQE